MAASDPDTIPRLDALEGWPAPDERVDWFGDTAAERVLLDAYRSGRMHHAWLIGGPRGIGKATLAYRFARFVLAHPDPHSPEVQAATDLSLPPDHSAVRRVARRAHPNLLALERPWDPEKKRYRTELTVSEIRRTVSFFGSTAGEAGWRIAIIDPADDMNASAANALLKVLEEPPARALFLIVAHAPGRIIPTIRSRTRKLALAPLPAPAIVDALAAGGASGDKVDLEFAATLAEGSLRRAILLLDQDLIEMVRSFFRLIGSLPDLDIPATHSFADAIAGRGADDAYDTFLDVLRGWLDRRVRGEGEPGRGVTPSALSAVPLARWAEVWEKVNRSAAQADELNLDRKQLVLSIFMTLAHATRM
jgi:DNA polymerase III subunit delta'